jgi:DEAD/DEAH box helicase domain-containing protein
VLQGYTIYDLPAQTVNLDMMLDLQGKLGFRMKLDAAASASLGTGKSADGLDALKWWQEYKKTGSTEPLMKIAEYCAFDVKVTKCVHEYALANGHLKFHDRGGQLQEVPVAW